RDNAPLWEGAALVKIAVEADHLVTGGLQNRGHDSPDVAPASCQQHAHTRPLYLSLDEIYLWTTSNRTAPKRRENFRRAFVTGHANSCLRRGKLEAKGYSFRCQPRRSMNQSTT